MNHRYQWLISAMSPPSLTVLGLKKCWPTAASYLRWSPSDTFTCGESPSAPSTNPWWTPVNNDCSYLGEGWGVPRYTYGTTRYSLYVSYSYIFLLFAIPMISTFPVVGSVYPIIKHRESWAITEVFNLGGISIYRCIHGFAQRWRDWPRRNNRASEPSSAASCDRMSGCPWVMTKLWLTFRQQQWSLTATNLIMGWSIVEAKNG